jgi:uncharacterized membrane protein (UPF0127 family)
MVSLLKVAAVAVAATVILFAAYEIYAMEVQQGTVTGPVPSVFTVNGRTYAFTYTATTEAERETGLMNRKITNTTTMLFAFPAFGTWTFWMYDTNTSLDIIWLNATGDFAKVVYLVTSAAPCYNSSACARYTPAADANYVIEARAGFAAANGIAVGTAVELS